MTITLFARAIPLPYAMETASISSLALRGYLVSLLLAALLALLSGCQTNTISQQSQFDPTDRTMTVPPGSSLLLGPIKEGLVKAGWKLVVDRGPDLVTGTVGENTNLASSNTFLTRYRLLIKQTQVALCFPRARPEVRYDLSVVDNRTGEEVLTESGDSCLGTGKAAGKFLAAIAAH